MGQPVPLLLAPQDIKTVTAIIITSVNKIIFFISGNLIEIKYQ